MPWESELSWTRSLHASKRKAQENTNKLSFSTASLENEVEVVSCNEVVSSLHGV